jgi:hypothetical protein
MFVGDIAGVNEMIGHYKSSKARCVVKDCKCDKDDVMQFPLKCQQVTWADLQSCDTVEEIFEMYTRKGMISEKDMCPSIRSRMPLMCSLCLILTKVSLE